MSRKYINKEKVIELVNKGLLDSEIADILKVKKTSIWRARKRFDIIKKHYNINNELFFTEKEKNIIIGSLLGDASLTLHKTWVNPKYIFMHGDNQKEYSLYKYEMLKRLNPYFKTYTRKTPDKRTGKYYISHNVYIGANVAFLKLYKEMYTPKKRITSNILTYYNDLSLAIHYMDDGYKSKSYYILCTDSFDIESIELFNLFLKEKFNLETLIDYKRKRILIKRKSFNIFNSIVNPHMIDSMRYKLFL